jgi:hypothetical protein
MMVGVISFIVGTLCLYRLGRWTVTTVSSGVWAYTTVHPALLTVGSIVTYPYTIPVLHLLASYWWVIFPVVLLVLILSQEVEYWRDYHGRRKCLNHIETSLEDSRYVHAI